MKTASKRFSSLLQRAFTCSGRRGKGDFEITECSRLYFNPAKRPVAMPPENSPGPSPDWLYPDLAYEIAGGLYEVHTLLGAGFVHRIYGKACYHELKLHGLAIQPAKRIQIAYKGKAIGDIAFAHLLVEGKIIVFPVAIGSIQDIHLENLKQWLALSDISLGILANFDAVKLEIMFIRR